MLGPFPDGGEDDNAIDEYCERAQLIQYAQYRALFEGFYNGMFQWYTGMIMWKSQGPWPGLRGALYDYYLSQTGGYYGVRAAIGGGAKVRVLLDQKRFTISVVNNHHPRTAHVPP